MKNAKCVQVIAKTIFGLLLIFEVNSMETLWGQSNAPSDDIVELSPFEVSTEKDTGYQATQSLVGRVAVNYLEMPTSVSIVTREMLDDLNAYEATQFVPYTTSGVGVSTNKYEDFNIRGFRSRLMLRNGVRMFLNISQPLYDVDRVEVIKGPGGLLHGEDYLGGVMNYTTIKPTSKPEGYAQLTLGTGSQNIKTVRYTLNSMGPLVKNENGFAINYRATIGGQQGKGHKEPIREDEQYYSGALSIRFNPKTTMDLSFSYTRDRGQTENQYEFLDKDSLPELKFHPESFKTIVAREQDSIYPWDVHYFDIEVKHTLTDNDFVRLFYHWYDSKRLNYTSDIGWLGNVSDDNTTIGRRGIGGLADFRDHHVQVDYVHYSKFGENVSNELLTGIDFLNERYHQIPTVTGTSGDPQYDPIDVYDPDYSNDSEVRGYDRSEDNGYELLNLINKNRQFSYYIQDNIKLFDEKLTLVGGVRWSKLEEDSYSKYTDTTTISSDPWQKSYKYGIVYKVMPWVSMYYTKANNVILRSGFLQDFMDPPTPVKNSDFNLYEGGFKFNFNNDKSLSFFGTVAFFDQRMTNVITNADAPPGNPAPTGQIQIQTEANYTKGWEADIGAKLTFEQGYLEMIITNSDIETRVAGTTNPSNNSPATIRSVLGKYSWTGGALEGTMVGFGMVNTGEIYNRGWVWNSPPVYTAFAAYDWKENWRFQLNIENLTDRRYFQNVSGETNVQPGPLRSIRFTMRYSW